MASNKPVNNKRKVWNRVKAPQKWWPPKTDSELIGTYLGTKTKMGQWGEYQIHLIQTRNIIYYISGTMTNDLFAMIPIDSHVKVVFTGNKLSKDGSKEYKTFEVYTEEVIEFKMVG